MLFAQNSIENVPDSTLRIAYSAREISALSVTNTYGKINYTGNLKDSIIIEVIIKLENTEEDFTEIYNMININSSVNKKTLELMTIFTDQFSSSNAFSVIYNIKGPKGLTLFINSQYCDIVINESGNVDGTINYGNITITKPIEKLKLDLKNGFANLSKTGIVNIKLSNSHLVMAETESMELNADFSNINIKKAGMLKVKCNTCELSLSEIRDISITSNLCFVKIDVLSENGYFEMGNGTLSINKTLHTLKNISASVNKTPVNIKMPFSFSYAIHGEIYNGKLYHPQHEKIRYLVEDESISFSGLIGNESSETTTPIILFSNGADIIIEHIE